MEFERSDLVERLGNVPLLFAPTSVTPVGRVPSKFTLCVIPELFTKFTVEFLLITSDVGVKVLESMHTDPPDMSPHRHRPATTTTTTTYSAAWACRSATGACEECRQSRYSRNTNESHDVPPCCVMTIRREGT